MVQMAHGSVDRFTLRLAALLALPVVQAASMAQADYKVAAEKCDALAGDAKAGCLTAAKARFGKT
ncbi:MAG: hypothetical protein V9G29_10180 [Burkholderiaceae bacterium]